MKTIFEIMPDELRAIRRSLEAIEQHLVNEKMEQEKPRIIIEEDR